MPVLIVFGATASGKTSLFYSLFSNEPSSLFKNKAEIINADSIQVYKGFEIGAASPSTEILRKLPHHLINIKNPDEEFSSADFVHKADIICESINNRGKLPVLLGGSAFFLKNFVYGLPITPKADETIRASLQNKLEKYGIDALYKTLCNVDPYTAHRLHINDHYRILRALEIYEASGKPLSSFKISEKKREKYNFKLIGIYRPRDIMYKRIDERVDLMFKEGLVEEFKKLYNNGYDKNTPAMKAIGYAEFFKISPQNPLNAPVNEVKELIKRNTRHYAKRQETFFKSIPEVSFFNLENTREIHNLESEIKEFLNL
ncbi:MAG: tRNA (adenosine(37)-N6)-dimethylallyltransferase MiaA [Treponema sp.]|nr:MAG: tRNA (adenosine(37)-N6)-dimethylallyltransferase MiaA [Treponema sp.]